jgi:hypothetical protein
MIGAVLKELRGLFVEDEFLAVGILAAVALVGMLVWADVFSTDIIGLILILALLGVLVAGVLRTVARQRGTSDASN